MRKLNNPYPPEGYKCFACSPSNPIGLKLEFEEDDEYVWARWQPGDNFQGYNNVLHGGIIATLLDETGAWYVSVKIGTAGVTKTMKVEYHKPVYISKGSVSIRAKMTERNDNLATIEAELFDLSGQKCAESISVFFLYPEEIARRRFFYPGREAF